MATGFTLMWNKMLDSSVWRQKSKETRLVWVTLLLMKDADGIVRAGVPGIMDRARVTRGECEKALKELSEPDEDTMTQEHEGRRIEKVGEGWLVLNHEKYRTSQDMREKWRRQKTAQRAREEIRDIGDENDIEGVGGLKGEAKEKAIAALSGFKGTTEELAAELKRIHGDEVREIAPEVRKERVAAKIARAEKVEAKVRAESNPGAEGLA